MISPQRSTMGENHLINYLSSDRHFHSKCRLNFFLLLTRTSFVHGRLPYDSINPDHHLRNLLCTIKQRKIVFTNSDRIHAMRSLDRLGIKDCFEQIICFETINPNLPYSTRPDEFPILLKPSLDAFKIALDAANVDPRRTVRQDDQVNNLNLYGH
ncbi:putative protein C24B11.05 isoform D [Glycine soja]|uniref:Uncharacterized protein n=1 Tax=Glycine soja TaxID=3848 RepID=A0A445F571_GLYSO|nr:putative protein C24B11.05 isoform D [Glycine soja]